MRFPFPHERILAEFVLALMEDFALFQPTPEKSPMNTPSISRFLRTMPALTGALLLAACSGGGEEFQTSTSTNAKKNTAASAPGAEGAPEVVKAAPLKPKKDRPRFAEGQVPPLQEYSFMGVQMELPKSWRQQTGTSQFRLTQFDLGTDAETSQSADFVVFYFGPGQGGTANSNLARWMTQIQTEGEPKVLQYEQNELLISELLGKGTLLPSTMGSGPKVPMADSFLYGLIVEGGVQGSLFIKATGPQSMLDELEPAFTHAVESTRKNPKTKAPVLNEAEAPAAAPAAPKAPGNY